VIGFISTHHVGPDHVVELFVLGPAASESGRPGFAGRSDQPAPPDRSDQTR
jgi:hypothetical protein